MPYERPFVTSRFTAYAGDSLSRRLSLAVLLTDEFTGEAPVGSFQVLLKQRRGEHRRGQEPVKKPGGFYCFLDIPDGTYTVVAEPSADSSFYYLRPSPGGTWSPDIDRSVVLPRPDPLEPVVELRLVPNTGYRFSGTATLVRGRVRRAGVPVAGAVVRSSYRRATPTPLNPQATALETVETRTDDQGYYVLFFNTPSPALQNIQVTAIDQGQQTEAATIREGRTTFEVIDLP